MTDDPPDAAPWTRDEVESPCIKLCVVEPATRRCLGCHRSLEEIAAWSQMTPEARHAILTELPARADASMPRRRGGRAGRLVQND